MSITKNYDVSAEVERRESGKTDTKTYASIREDGYMSEFMIWHDKWYSIPLHSLDEVADLAVALEKFIEEVQGIDNGSLINK